MVIQKFGRSTRCNTAYLKRLSTNIPIFVGLYNRYFWNIRLKICSLCNFNTPFSVPCITSFFQNALSFVFSQLLAYTRKPETDSVARSVRQPRDLWSAICFKIMTRYTCGFFPRILAIIPATRYTCVFLSHAYTCVLFPSIWPFSYKQACGI